MKTQYYNQRKCSSLIIFSFTLFISFIIPHIQAQELSTKLSQPDSSQVFSDFKIPASTKIKEVPEKSAKYQNSEFTKEIIIQTGESIDGSGPIVSLGSGPSINNKSKIAFTAIKVSENFGTVLLYDNGTYLKNYYTPPHQPGATLQVNDEDHIAYWDSVFVETERIVQGDSVIILGDPWTHIYRLDTENSGPAIAIANNLIYRWDTEFEYVTRYVSLANNDRVIFGGNLRSGGTVLASRTSGSDEYQMTNPVINSPTFFPKIADNNRAIVRGGASESSSIVLFLDEHLGGTNGILLANTPEFLRMGNKPGISDDGNIAVFMAEHSTEGAGIYVTTVNKKGDAVQFKLVDLPGTSTNLNYPVAVNKAGSSAYEYMVVYHAYDGDGAFSLFAKIIDVSNPYSPVLKQESTIIKVGETIAGLDGKIKHINIYDPVNNLGEIVYWVETESGNQAIIRSFDFKFEINSIQTWEFSKAEFKHNTKNYDLNVFRRSFPLKFLIEYDGYVNEQNIKNSIEYQLRYYHNAENREIMNIIYENQEIQKNIEFPIVHDKNTLSFDLYSAF